MWSENWGEMLWGNIVIPMMSPLGLVLVALGLMVLGKIVLSRRTMEPFMGVALVAIVIVPLVAMAVTVPNTFVNGTTADADEVNANFDALAAAVNGITGLFGNNTSLAANGTGELCTLGDVWLTAGNTSSGERAEGQLFSTSQNAALHFLLGTTYGGDGVTNFALPDLRDAAPNGLTYVICINGVFPSQS